MTMPPRVKRFTPEEYYRLEDSRIAVNLGREVDIRIEGGPCLTYNSDLRLKVVATGLRTYPDLTVYCQELQSDPEDPFDSTYVNPTVIFDVLSTTTEAYDRGFKSENYRQIDSLKAYVLVSQNHPHAEIYERNGDKWDFREFKGLDDALKIPPLGIEIPLERVYLAVKFEPTMRPLDD